MTRKTSLYIILTILVSLSLVFGSIQSNFSFESDELSNISSIICNNSYNNSTVQENTTMLNIPSVNQTAVVPVNQTINIYIKNQTTLNISTNTILNPFTAVTAPTNITNGTGAAAGDIKPGITGIINQTGELPLIKSSLSLKQCLKQTVNAQSKDPKIKALVKKITKGTTSKYKKAVKIFKWVRDNLGYSFYYNTKYGALKTLKKKTGNCVDTSHLLVALLRAAGIPARYVHVNAQFPDDNFYGHVFVQAYTKGKWRNLDASSTKNSFDIIRKWNTATAEIKGVYTSLPF